MLEQDLNYLCTLIPRIKKPMLGQLKFTSHNWFIGCERQMSKLKRQYIVCYRVAGVVCSLNYVGLFVGRPPCSVVPVRLLLTQVSILFSFRNHGWHTIYSNIVRLYTITTQL